MDHYPNTGDYEYPPFDQYTPAKQTTAPPSWEVTLPVTGQPPKPPRRRFWLRVASIVLTVAIIGAGLMVVRQRGVGQATTPPTTIIVTATATPHPTTPPPPLTVATATAPVTTCSAITSFAQASPAATSSTNFLAVTFPAGSVMVAETDSEHDGFQTRSVPTCTPSMPTATALQAAYTSDLATTGWQLATTSGQGCGNVACWQQADTRFTPAVMQYVSLAATSIMGSVATYTLQLTIAPIFTGTAVPMSRNSTFTFDQAPLPELAWDATLHLNGNTLAALLPTNTYATTTYADLDASTISYTHINAIPINQGETSALQSARGYFLKFFIQGVNADQTMITVTYIVYPYGF